MFELVSGWLVIVVPVALGVLVIAVPSKSDDKAAHMRWRYGLAASLVVYAGLVSWQQSRATEAAAWDKVTAAKLAKQDRESAVKETVDSTSASVTRSVTALYAQEISDQKAQIADLKSHLRSLQQLQETALIFEDEIISGQAPTVKQKLRAVMNELEQFVDQRDANLNPKYWTGNYRYQTMVFFNADYCPRVNDLVQQIRHDGYQTDLQLSCTMDNYTIQQSYESTKVIRGYIRQFDVLYGKLR
jgi:hypothetical protein